MSHYVNRRTFGDLIKAGRLPVRFRMHVQCPENGSRSLGGKGGGTCRKILQLVDLFRRHQLARIGPTLGALCSANLHKPPPGLQNLYPVTVFQHGDDF